MMKKNKMTVIIESDFEPDDLIFIKHCVLNHIGELFIIIVGESIIVNHKMKFAEKFMSSLNVNFVIHKGIGSTKDFPRMFEEEENKLEETKLEEILENYEKIYKDPTIIKSYMLKPPREAIKLLEKQENKYDFEVIAYGSFNWRTLKIEDPLIFTKLMKQFKKFIYIDSFTAIGENNSHFFLSEKESLTNNLIKELIYKWNEHIINEAKKVINDESISEDKKYFSRKIINNIEKIGIDKQFVLADVSLLLINYFSSDLIPVELESLKPFNKWTPDETSSIMIFKEEGKEERRNKLLEILKE